MSRPIVYFAALAAVFATAHLASAVTVVAAGASDQTFARLGAGVPGINAADPVGADDADGCCPQGGLRRV